MTARRKATRQLVARPLGIASTCRKTLLVIVRRLNIIVLDTGSIWRENAVKLNSHQIVVYIRTRLKSCIRFPTIRVREFLQYIKSIFAILVSLQELFHFPNQHDSPALFFFPVFLRLNQGFVGFSVFGIIHRTYFFLWTFDSSHLSMSTFRKMTRADRPTASLM